jgi:hypothetical protein
MTAPKAPTRPHHAPESGAPARDFHTPEQLKAMRRRGGLRGSKAHAAKNRLAKVFAELDETEEP